MNRYLKAYNIVFAVATLVFIGTMTVFGVFFYYLFAVRSIIIALVGVLASFAGQYAVTRRYFMQGDRERVIFNMPVVSFGMSVIIASSIICPVTFIAPFSVVWYVLAEAALLLAFYLIAAANSHVGDEPADTQPHRKKSGESAFMRKLELSAESLIPEAKTPGTKAMAVRMHEIICGSDKSKFKGSEEIESKISAVFTVFAEAVSSGDEETARATGRKIIELLAARNRAAGSAA